MSSPGHLSFYLHTSLLLLPNSASHCSSSHHKSQISPLSGALRMIMPLCTASLMNTPLHPDCLKMTLACFFPKGGYLFPQILRHEDRCWAQYALDAASKLLFLYPGNAEVHDAQLLFLSHYPIFMYNFGI